MLYPIILTRLKNVRLFYIVTLMQFYCSSPHFHDSCGCWLKLNFDSSFLCKRISMHISSANLKATLSLLEDEQCVQFSNRTVVGVQFVFHSSLLFS